MPRQSFPVSPRRLQRAGRAYRGPFVGGGDSEEVLDAHDAHVRNRAQRPFVHRHERCADRRRTDDTGVHHAGHHEVLNVSVAPRALVRHVRSEQRLADRRVLRRRRERRVAVDLERESSIADERSDPDAGASCARPHLAIHDRQVRRRPIELRGAERQQGAPRRCGGGADFGAAAHEPGASAGSTLVGTDGRIAFNDRHA